MGQNKVIINQQDGGLGRQEPNLDHVSALLFEHVAAPSAWSVPMRSFRSLKAVEAAGILEHDLQYGICHYHAKEYFRLNKGGLVYIGFQIMQASSVADRAQLIRANTADYRVRQFGVFSANLADTVKYQELADALKGLEMDAVFLMGLEAPIYFSSLTDLSTRTQEKVHVIVAGDGDALGKSYADALGIVYTPCVGTALGALSRIAVHESFGYVRENNLTDDVELATPIFSNGVLLKDTLPAYLDDLHDKHYGFLRTYEDVEGVYFDDNKTCTAATSDYSTLNINRVAQKAARGVRAALVPEISANARVNANTGRLRIGYIEYLNSIGGQPLLDMETAGELEGYSLVVPEDQNVLSTSNIVAQINIVPLGVSRNFNIDLSFVLKL